MKVFVIGSCISRDAFALPEAEGVAEISHYSARSSLAVLPTGRVRVPLQVQNMPSPWRRRMIEADHRKSLLQALASVPSDLVLLDLIDERFNLLEIAGALATLSVEYMAVVPKPFAGTVIASGSDRHVKLWNAGFALLMDRLREAGRLDRLRVNRVYWATHDNSGAPLSDPSQERIAAANAFLEGRYADIARHLGSHVFFEYPAELMVADRGHKWGLSPFHYLRKFYLAQLDHFADFARSLPVEGAG